MGILKAAGIDPASQQNTGPTWAAFLRSQAEAILACDFVVVDLLDGSKAYVLAVIERATRRVRVLDHVPYLPEKHITAKLPLLHHLLTTHAPAMDDTSATASAATSHTPATTPQEVIDCLRTHGLALAYDPRTRTLEISGKPAARTTI
jgi:hypothetical protein